MAQLRQHGFERLDDVKAAYIEGDGQFSVVGRGRPQAPRRHRAAAGGR